MAPFVRFVAEDGDALAEAFCGATADVSACAEALDLHTAAAQRAGYDLRAVAVIAPTYEFLFGPRGPIPCPIKDGPLEVEPGPTPPLDLWTSTVAERELADGAVRVIETYAYTGDGPPRPFEGRVGADEVPPVGVGTGRPLAPEAYRELWAEENAGAVRARYEPPRRPCCRCIPDPTTE